MMVLLRTQGQFVVDESAAIATLYRHYAPALLTYLRLHTPSRKDAEDFLVDTFLAALENTHFSHLSQEEQYHWLWRVANNKVVDWYRGTARWTYEYVIGNFWEFRENSLQRACNFLSHLVYCLHEQSTHKI